MQREIGSEFWLNPNKIYAENKRIDLRRYEIDGMDEVFLSTGRGAQTFVLETIEGRDSRIKKIALIPPFTCETVIKPFISLGYEIHTYRIDENLNVNPELLKEDIDRSKAQVVLLHRYFGFDTLKDCNSVIDEARQNGIVFIEDRTQNLYSQHVTLNVDYIIGSFRKWTGLPDGGFAVCREGIFSYKPDMYDEKLEEMKLSACYLKYNYMEQFQGDKQKFLERYREAEHILSTEVKYYNMSPMSVKIQTSLDLQNLKQKRQENYKKVYDALNSYKGIVSVTPELSKDDVPLYYVMIVKDRETLQSKLRNYDIYAPIVWPMSSIKMDICSMAKRIYNHVLCLPIDQRYGSDDIERMIECVKKEI